jgi:hypothetical protein
MFRIMELCGIADIKIFEKTLLSLHGYAVKVAGYKREMLGNG